MFAALLDRASTSDVPQSLAAYDLPELTIDFGQFTMEKNRLIREELSLASDPEVASTQWDKFNADQSAAASTIVEAVETNTFTEHTLIDEDEEPHLFFLDGPGGTGKTFVQNTVMAKLRSEGKIVLAVASSGIAATLLDGGQTAHARFKIPLDSEDSSMCDIKKGTDRCELIRKASMIFWDEAPMQRKYDFLAVSRTISDLCDVDERIPFGGKVVCFCGDFRQCMPVVPNAPPGTIINMCIQKTPFWSRVRILRLTINMRLQNPDLSKEGRREAAAFAKQVLEVGDAVTTQNIDGQMKIPWTHGFIPKNSQQGLIDAIYPDLQRTPPEASYLGERAILAVANLDVGHINNACVDRLAGQVYLRYSNNTPVDPDLTEEFGDECFHHYDEASLPPHILRLKIGMPVMVIRNLDPPVECNGTRARLTQIGAKVLEAEVIGGKPAVTKILIPRIPLNSKNDEGGRNRRTRVPCPFTRRQFPVRPAFAMTINKSQGHSLKHVGVDIHTREVFTHGQLYVALSRVTKQCNLRVIVPEDTVTTPHWIRNVQWPQVLLKTST